MKTPFVTIMIPCFNEQKFIGRCLDSIIANDYPQDRLEVLVIDGMSNDTTRTIVGEYIQKNPVIRLVDNPRRLKPYAFNTGIETSRGDIIIIMGAHAIYEPDYISKCISYMEHYQADNVGGSLRTLPSDSRVLSRAIAYSNAHSFGMGNTAYRTGAKTIKWVDTVFGGCYRRETFEKIGVFDERLVRGQDREFNVRLQRAGGKILYVPDIVCHYFARSDLKSFLHWIYVGGLTPIYISRITGKVIFSWRNMIPLAFVISIVGSLLLTLVRPVFRWLLLLIGVVYLVPCLVFSVPIAWKERDPRFLIAMPFIFAATHILYGLGSIAGLFKPIQPQSEWSKV